ncbi:MAG: universal stress protein, partial [Terracoccus sp.]
MVDKDTGSVVVGIDGTAGSAGALRYAVQQARQRHRHLRLVHARPRYEGTSPIDPYLREQIEETGRSLLSAARDQAEKMAPDLTITTVLESGSRVAVLTRVADGGELLVLGRETRKGFDRLLFGATTAAVAARATVPTAVVPDSWRPKPCAGRIVVGLRAAEHSAELLEAAIAHAAASGASLEVVHAWELPDAYNNIIEARTHDAYWVHQGTRLV